MPLIKIALFLCACWAWGLQAAPAGKDAAAALPTFRVGVLAFRPKPETRTRWQPLAEYLNQAVPGARFALEAYTYPELEKAVAEGRVEFILTQPSHYVALTHTKSLSSPLATLVEREDGHALDRFGGVIFSRAGRTDLTDLVSLRGRAIALSATSSLGGYQMQAFELAQAGVRLPRDARLVVTGQPQDKVVKEVLEGRADAGLVRTGVLEAMQREGKADLKQFQIINAAPPGRFPFHLSTRLYPEWPVAAMPGADQAVARRVAAALLALPHDSPTARALRIQGFAIPGDYHPVDDLLRELRLPPFDKTPPITARQVWERWQSVWIILIGAVAALLGLMVLRLSGRNRELLRLQEEQRQAQARIRESEQHFRNLANSGSALIWTSGVDKRCDYFNEPWLQFRGRELEQELGDGWTEGVHPDDLVRCADIYARSFDRRRPFVMEYRLLHADGAYRWILDEGRPRHDSAGGFVGYIGHCYDITERRQALEQVRRERDNTRNILETVEAIILLLDPEGRISRINRRGCEVLGYQPDELTGRNWFETCLPPGDDRQLQQGLFHGVLARDSALVERHEGQVLTRSGELRLIAWRNRVIRDERGEVIGMLSSGEDVTEHRQAEDRLRQAASVFATAREGIMITNTDGEILDVNAAFTWITGYPREEILGKNPRFLSGGLQDREFYAGFWRALQEEGFWRGEIWNRRKTGELYVEWLTVSAVRDEAGRTQRYVALFSDITSQKEHQKQLERLAHFDPLTGLPNRTLLADRLQLAMAQARRRGFQLAVALIDLDGFKEINDRYGHKSGDDLLMEVANRMRESVREGDTVARIGGDEFVAVLADLTSDRECLPMIQRLLHAAAAPVHAGERLLQVSGSIGFTFYPQEEEVDAEQLLRQADQAMYQAKVAGKNRYHIFDTEHDRAMRGHHESLERIRQGLAGAEELRAIALPRAGDGLQHARKSGPPPAVLRREVGAAEKRLALRG